MSNEILKHIKLCKQKGEKLLSILLDPDKIELENLSNIVSKIDANNIDFIFVGGSIVEKGKTNHIVNEIKKLTTIPIILFPGNSEHISNSADALLFLSLISGRNPEYLIGQQVKSVKTLKETSLEIIPTGYVLIDGGVETSVQKVSKTTPISQSNLEDITITAMAGELMGKQLIYLEAGSGATKAVSQEIIKTVAESLSIPIIVGGGIRTKKQLKNAYDNGADMVVIGTAFEENNNILKSII